jgi:hypothetical protein
VVKIEGEIERERAKRRRPVEQCRRNKKLVKGESQRWSVKGREQEYNCTKTKMAGPTHYLIFMCVRER